MDLAEFRLLRALRAGTGAAFTQLWNAQAGAAWSVFRALVNEDSEALGWMGSFRVDLQERTPSFRADEGVAPQVGRALYEHALASFSETGPLPTHTLPQDELGVRQLPACTRLGYLVDLFFDWTPPDPSVRAAYRLLEPSADTDARLLVHTALLRNPPGEALILPPGVTLPPERPPAPPRLRFALLGGAVLAAILAFAGWTAWRPPDPIPLHEDALSASGGVLVEGNPERLATRLQEAGAPALLSECPLLNRESLRLVGGRYDGGVVVCLYFGLGADWTLQHRSGGALPGEDVGEGRSGGDDDGVVFASWRDAAGVWTLAARVNPDTMSMISRLVVEDRAASTAQKEGEGELR